MSFTHNFTGVLTITAGDDYSFNGGQLTVEFTTDILDLTNFKAYFVLEHNIQYFEDISSKIIHPTLDSAVTSKLQTGIPLNGWIKIEDPTGKIHTLDTPIQVFVNPKRV